MEGTRRLMFYFHTGLGCFFSALEGETFPSCSQRLGDRVASTQVSLILVCSGLSEGEPEISHKASLTPEASQCCVSGLCFLFSSRSIDGTMGCTLPLFCQFLVGSGEMIVAPM